MQLLERDRRFYFHQLMVIYAIPEQQSSAFEVDVDGKYQQRQGNTGEEKEYNVELGVIMAICFGCCAKLEGRKGSYS